MRTNPTYADAAIADEEFSTLRARAARKKFTGWSSEKTFAAVYVPSSVMWTKLTFRFAISAWLRQFSLVFAHIPTATSHIHALNAPSFRQIRGSIEGL